MNIFVNFLINIFILEIFSCSRIHFIPFPKKETKHLEDKISEFLQYALSKIRQEEHFDIDDMRKLIFYTHQINKMEKQYNTPSVYWYTRKG
jgi:hypothetical protein